MLKKYKYLIIAILTTIFITLLSTGIYFGVQYYKKYDFKIENNYTINTDESYVRIYYDFASVPTLYQVYDYAQQKPQAISFVLWDRIPNLEQNLKNNKNTKVIKHLSNNDIMIDPKDFQEFLKQHPNEKYIIHSNNMWFKIIFPMLFALPKEAVKEIHLYEDGTFATTYKMHPKQEEDFDKWRKDILKNYKVIYHIQDADLLNSPRCLLYKRCTDMKMKYKDDIVVQNSLDKMRTHFKQDQKLKDAYFSVYNFDYKKYEKEMTHPFGIFTFTLYTRHSFAKAQIKFMNELINGNLRYLVKDKNVKWFYKEHPARKEPYRLRDKIADKYPNLTYIEKHTPTELFLLADIIPDYVAGYSSGVFMTMPKKSIVAYITTKKDPYMYLIKRDHLIRAGRIFYLYDFEKKPKAFFKRFVSRILVLFQ